MSNDDTQVVETDEAQEDEAVLEPEEETEKPKSGGSDDKGDQKGLPDDPEILREEIKKLRKENAAKRTKNREQEEAAKKWQEHLNSQKTELEQLQEQLQALQQENHQYKLERLQRELAQEHGVDPDLTEFIVGADLDEMVEKAKKLASKTAKAKKTSANDLRAGNRGPKADAGDSSKWLKDLFYGKG